MTVWRAFNLAEKHQTPALVFSDHYLAVAVRTLELDAFDFGVVEIERGELLSEVELDALDGDYLRYRITNTGRSVDNKILKYDGRAFTPEYITSFKFQVNSKPETLNSKLERRI